MEYAQDPSYFEHVRQDILRVAPARVGSLLSTGCGAGGTEAEFARRGAHVVGIEMDATAAATARDRGIEMLVGDAIEVSDQLDGRTFDCLLYADVLEHIRDPEEILRRHVQMLEPGGSIIISVPNFRHFSVLIWLFLKGVIPYKDAGIFDRTHVRITTSKLIGQWLEGVGARVTSVSYPMNARRYRLASRLTLGLFKEFIAKQVILVGKLPAPAGAATAAPSANAQEQR